MSPVTLHLEYFGPYRDTTIDFTKFAATPLFLISGKTGSGKTTIFDGMCYALFNQTSGVDREAKAMRSDFATATDTTRVTFVFTHRERRYEIVREPTQILAKKRGTGMTESAANVTLTIFEDGVEQDQLTKEGKVGRYLQNLLQMDGKQFAQIVLLPQGQFRKFLIAPSEDKAAVLEQLFNTTIFARWSALLKQRLKHNEAANRETAATLARLQSGLKWTPENQPQAAELLADQRTTDLLALMATQQATTQAQQEQLKQRLTQAEQAQTKLVRQDEQETLLLKDQQQLAQQQTVLTELAAQTATMQAKQQQIAELEWAQQLQSQWQTRIQAVQTVTQRQHDLQQAQAALEAAKTQQKKAVATQQDQQPLVAKIKAQTDKLAQQQALKPVYQQVADLQQQVTAATQLTQQTAAALATSQQAVRDNQQQQAQQQQVVDQQATIYDAQNQLIHRQATLQTTAQQLTTGQQLAQQLQQSQVAEKNSIVQLNAAQSAAQQQRTQADELYQGFLRSQIAELSAQLTPGTPCPVCGSTEHPQPATTTLTAVVAEDTVKEAQEAATKLEKKASDLAATHHSLQQRLAEQQTAYQEQVTILQSRLQQSPASDLTALTQTYQEQLAAFKADQATNRKQLAALEAAQQALKQLTTTATQLQEQMQQAEVAAQTQQSRLDKLTTELTTEQKRLPADAATLSQFMTQLTTLAQQVKQDQADWDAANLAVQQAQTAVDVQQSRLIQAQTELTASQEQLTQVETVVNQALVTHLGQADAPATERVTQLMAALPTLATQRKQVADYQQRRDQVKVMIDTLRERTQGKAAPDRAQTQQALATAKQRVATLQEQGRQLRNLYEFNADQVQQLETQVNKQTAALKTTQEITELSGVVNGDGPNSKLGLERYVLQTYLRQILTVGNDRLQQLTNGRYQFVIDESQANSKKRSGLEINVYDDHVGEQRSVHTLSGGESFIASLALALALGEVIQQTTGSVDVDALFIDEGFGSLDEDALMTALESLETIEGRHRMIGIISHVSELRDQVENQLQVVANGNGESTIRYHAAE